MNKTAVLLFVIAMLGVVAGCGDDFVTPGDQLIAAAPPTSDFAISADHSAILDALDYEEFTGTITPGMGGWLQTSMTTWPKGCNFSIMVPSNALPDDNGNPVTFTMRIPTYQSYVDYAAYDLPLIIRLSPSNIDFQVPVTVMATYMPWNGLTANDIYAYWTAAPEYEFFGTPPTVYQDGQRVRIVFPASHFSDWEVGGERNKGPQ